MAWPRKRQNKFKAIKTEVDGITFHSKSEAVRYGELKMALKAGVIKDLKLQVRYPLIINGVKIADYYADFTYLLTKDQGHTWQFVVEDRKGYLTDVYKLKKKMMKAIHGIDIYES